MSNLRVHRQRDEISPPAADSEDAVFGAVGRVGELLVRSRRRHAHVLVGEGHDKSVAHALVRPVLQPAVEAPAIQVAQMRALPYLEVLVGGQ